MTIGIVGAGNIGATLHDGSRLSVTNRRRELSRPQTPEGFETPAADGSTATDARRSE